jgi:hybrid polyketide synthase/nonribosomal peptide synthetase ACE1
MARQNNEPIAVIGSGCRFPGESSSPSKLWELLCQPRDLSKRIPVSRFNPDGFYHPDGLHHGSSNVRDSYVLSEDHRHFDAQFFNIKPSEANSVDPQQRLLLETVYEAIESAGLKLEDMQGSATAVYVGVMGGDYSDLILRDLDSIPTYFATGTARSILSNRISYFFDWRGPSMTIDTACSSSLVAVHQAVQALREGCSRVAIAAGANLILGPENYVAESKLKMLSPNGRSRMWDIDADGYARGDGFAAITLKTLSAALEDGDDIECIIRETGINQDGRTKGITMPSATAQADLMCDTYRRAGLDLSKSSDRCQYFEAHGTGTPAGDPIEAEAISRAFHGAQSNTGKESESHGILYVGSVKTIIGHTEGTAGLAGLLKVSLALRYGLIPPNLHLNRLNPSVAPFYNNLEIPTALKEWPAVPNGCPRRASLNSFGFGGTNAHAILESYEPSSSLAPPKTIRNETVFMPFTFSASTESSLRASLGAYSAFLKANKTTDLRDLAWTLASRRSEFALKASFSGLTVDSLCSKLDTKLGNTEVDIGVRSSSNSPSILGVFTGQGAQWAGMGRELILSSEVVRQSIESLERHLAELPIADRPSWSLKTELLATASTSRLQEATIAQPLCTAIQIVLVDLLRTAGVKFSAVVGHSSGEIGAAYAAGYISAQHAICIAYYRGLHSQLAIGPNGKKGAMMAVGTSLEDAQEICELPDFIGRISVAASNSAASVTLSGDVDAIEEAKQIFDEEKKFARLLKVDKAYHSHHMLACSEKYIASLRQCKIEVRRQENAGCTWFSSVYGGDLPDSCDNLGDVYWNTNMLHPVLFSEAVSRAVEKKSGFDVALEIGPHPALQGPVLQVIQQISGKSIPYCGLLGRGKNDIEAVSEALGFVWGHLGSKAVDFHGYDSQVSGGAGFKLLKDLPSYSWDHDRIFWYESRVSRAFRTREDSCHELLGVRTADGTEQEIRWRNILSVKEIPWLQGHQIQGEIVFPAAGYVAMALEASESLVKERSVTTIEVQDLVIGRPISFPDEETGVETLFTLTDVKDEMENGGICTANFMCYSTPQNHKKVGAMTLMATGRIEIAFGEPSSLELPPRSSPSPNLVDVDTGRFYSALNDLGYGYSGPFKGLSTLKRKMDVGTGLVANPQSSDPAKPLLVHPAMLDSAFQAIFLGYCWPGDGRLWSMHVPTNIERIRVNASLCRSVLQKDVQLPFDCVLSANSSFPLYGDVDIYAQDGQTSIIQIEGITAVPLSAAAPADDRNIFSEITWDVAVPNGPLVAENDRATAEDIELASLCERVAHFYLKNLDENFPKGCRSSLQWNFQRLLDFASHTVSLVSAGKHPFAKKEWAHDSHDQVISLTQKYAMAFSASICLANTI